MIEVVGEGGAVGRAVRMALDTLGATGGGRDVRILATPATTWAGASDGVASVAAAVRHVDVTDAAVTIPVAGWWGGLGTLLASVALGEAVGASAVHVAYGLPGARRVWRRASPTLRTAAIGAATDPVRARVDGKQVQEVAGESRRLAWFPKPVGPAHAAAIAGLEVTAGLEVATLRTWVAAGSMGSEVLQAIGRSSPQRGIGGVLIRRAAARGGGPGATAELRWACVVEALDADGGVVRAWANGVDPVAATGAMLATTARDLATAPDTPPIGSSLLALGPAESRLDALADLGVLRWSVARPEPTRR